MIEMISTASLYTTRDAHRMYFSSIRWMDDGLVTFPHVGTPNGLVRVQYGRYPIVTCDL